MPWVQHGHLRVREIAGIARNYGQIVMKGYRRQRSLDDWQLLSFTLCFGGEQASTICNCGINRRDSSREPGFEFNLQPYFQTGPAPALG